MDRTRCGAVDNGGVPDHGEVELTLDDALDQVGAGGEHGPHRDRAGHRHRGGQAYPNGPQAGRKAEKDRAAGSGDLGCGVLEALTGLDQIAGQRQQRRSRRRDVHASGVAVEEPDAQPSLEASDPLRQGRLRHSQVVCRVPEVTYVGHRDEEPQMTQEIHAT